MSKEKYPLIAVGAIPDSTFHDDFNNEFGDTFSVVIDRDAQTGTLRGSDIGEFMIAGNGICGDVILADEEVEWLSNAWHRATGRKLNAAPSLATLFKRLSKILAEQNDGGSST